MAKTFTEQVNMPNTRWTNDGAGMHSAIPFDMIRGLNNLGTYVNNHAQYVQNSGPTFGSIDGVADSAQEVFMLQIPIVVPKWAKRMLWTHGVSCSAGSLSAVTAYLGRSPYVGPFSLDTSFMALGFVARTSATSVTSGNYALINDSSIGFADLAPALAGVESKTITYMTISITGSATDSGVHSHDLTCWFVPT